MHCRDPFQEAAASEGTDSEAAGGDTADNSKSANQHKKDGGGDGDSDKKEEGDGDKGVSTDMEKLDLEKQLVYNSVVPIFSYINAPFNESFP